MGREPWCSNNKGLSQPYKSSRAGWPFRAALNWGFIPLHLPGTGCWLTWGRDCLLKKNPKDSPNWGWLASLGNKDFSHKGQWGNKGFSPKGQWGVNLGGTLQHPLHSLLYFLPRKPLRLFLILQLYSTFSSFITGCYMMSKRPGEYNKF